MVYAWTRKEFKNLEKLNNAKVSAPLALAVKDNVLAMEFIGKNGIASKTLKEISPKGMDYKKIYGKLIEFMARMLYLEELVHADLSEYNVLMRENDKTKEFEPVIIDVGQGVMTMHPMAQEFFERDVQNIVNYFSKKGIETSKEKAIEEIKKWKGKLLKEKQKQG